MQENKIYDWANCQPQNKKKQQVKSIKVVNCNIDAAIKLQHTYNDAICTHTVCAMYTTKVP